MAVTVPVVSLAHPDASAAIDHALTTIGFFVIVDHGVSSTVIDNAWEQSTQFFDLPPKMKSTWMSSDSAYPYGYEPMEQESLAAAHGGQAVPDLKESFNVGPPVQHGGLERTWPDQPFGFRAAWIAYYEAMEQLAETLMGPIRNCARSGTGPFRPQNR